MLDFMVMEAVSMKVDREEAQEQEQAKRRKFTKDRSDLLSTYANK